jgi:hypothetical protein
MFVPVKFLVWHSFSYHRRPRPSPEVRAVFPDSQYLVVNPLLMPAPEFWKRANEKMRRGTVNNF